MGLVVPWHVGSSWTRDQTRVPCIGRQILNHSDTKEVPWACSNFEVAFSSPSSQESLRSAYSILLSACECVSLMSFWYSILHWCAVILVQSSPRVPNGVHHTKSSTLPIYLLPGILFQVFVSDALFYFCLFFFLQSTCLNGQGVLLPVW